MMFLFKKKPIVLDCFTTKPHVYTFAKPAHSTKFFPQWWKDLPAGHLTHSFETGLPTLNMRGCTGMIDFYKNSVALPMWTDMAVEVGSMENPEYRYQFADLMSELTVHSPAQHQGFAEERLYQHFKLTSPWVFRTKEHIDWVAVGAFYNQQALLAPLFAPGVVNFKYSGTTHVQIFVPRHPTQSTRLDIAYGTPTYMYFPQSEREVDIRTHLIDATEMEKVQAITQRIVFSRAGLLTRRLMKRGEINQCPLNHERNK